MDNKSIEQRLKTLDKLKEKVRNDIEIEKKSLLTDFKTSQAISVSPKVHVKETNNENKKQEYLQFRNKVSDSNFFKNIKPLLNQMPESNGSRFFSKINVNIGIIADEFLFNSYKGVANFFYITRENYKKYKDKLDVFLVVSTWKGLNMEWKGLGNPKIRKHRDDLDQIINYYRKQGTKIIFYSKEDPVNYDIFIDIAKKCDYIFTTAEEKIQDYKRDCKTENVHVLDFGVNPNYHNPIGIRKFPKRKEVLFTGSWYEKYPHRQTDTRILFDGVIDGNKDLKIIDRNYELKLEAYFFPKEYLKYVSPSVEHQYLQRLHKLFDWAINLNTVKESNTMFANRVYELQALGNLLFSNYSVGVNNKFPNVFLINNKNEIKDIFKSFTDEDVYNYQVQGIRRVMSYETSYQRIEDLLEMIDHPIKKQQKRIAVLTDDKNKKIKEMFENQTYPFKELFRINEFSEEKMVEYDFVTFFNKGNNYGEFYLEDMINGFKYTDSDYITKDAYLDGDKLIKGIEFDYIDTIKDKSRTVFSNKSFTFDELLKLENMQKVSNGFSIDHFEFNTQVQEKDKVLTEYKLSVIVASYNNGDHLLNKCFNSLKRSSLFKNMEIIIVDDGSTDNYTPMIVNRLVRENNNVKAYFYNDGGSGSASRPRNKGYELSTAPFITYLDPDNEAINDGYYHLYKEIENNEFDLVVGNMVKLDTKEANFDYYKTAIHFNGSDVISNNVKEYLVKSQFKAMSIQALIFKRELISKHSLEMVEGAAGEDTLFFQELLINSKKTKVIDLPIHIYYAAVSGSTVNSISKRFFEKYYLLEKTRVNVLRKEGLLKDFLEKRFDFYFKGWYLEKLKSVKEEEALDSIKILSKIYDLYRNDFTPVDPDVIRFKELSAANKFDEIKNSL